MKRQWLIGLVAALALADVVAAGVGYRARSGVLPPWQVHDASFPVVTGAAAPDDSTSADPNRVAAPLMMAMNSDGLLVRATRGACEQGLNKAVQVAVGNVTDDTGALTQVTIDGLAEVLGVLADDDGTLRVSGLDAACKNVNFESTDEGASWTASGDGKSSGLWHLDPDTTASSVIGPRGAVVTLPCPPDQVTNLPRRRALASCVSGVFYDLAPDADPKNVPAPGFGQLSAAALADDGHYVIFGATSSCGAQVGGVTADSQAIDPLKCFGKDVAPLAVVASGNRVVVQVGYELQLSTDGGNAFHPILGTDSTTSS